jgi:hypothetical protein
MEVNDVGVAEGAQQVDLTAEPLRSLSTLQNVAQAHLIPRNLYAFQLIEAPVPESTDVSKQM